MILFKHRGVPCSQSQDDEREGDLGEANKPYPCKPSRGGLVVHICKYSCRHLGMMDDMLSDFIFPKAATKRESNVLS